MIYCVEDDAAIRELIVYTLENTGFRAVGFDDGAALLHALETELPELILMDIMLPGEDGVSLLKKIRADERTGHIAVIMLTAKGSEYDKVLALDLGADDYVTKPFGMVELLSRIRAVLRRTGRQKQEEGRETETGRRQGYPGRQGPDAGYGQAPCLCRGHPDHSDPEGIRAAPESDDGTGRRSLQRRAAAEDLGI